MRAGATGASTSDRSAGRRPGWRRTASPTSRCSSTPSSAWKRCGGSTSRTSPPSSSSTTRATTSSPRCRGRWPSRSELSARLRPSGPSARVPAGAPPRRRRVGRTPYGAAILAAADSVSARLRPSGPSARVPAGAPPRRRPRTPHAPPGRHPGGADRVSAGPPTLGPVPFSVATTPYGRPAAGMLASQVRGCKAGDPFAPVTVVVPATYAGIAARRRLAADGVVAVTFLTMSRLAERLGGPALAAAGRRPESPPVVLEVVRRVLRDRPGMFAPVADHPATEVALAAAHAELRGVSDAALDAVAAASPRSADVIAIHRAVTRLLRAAWHDEYDLIAAAADALEHRTAID